MREAVADCDDGSSDGSLMLLSPPHDIPEASLPVDFSMDLETRDVVYPVVIATSSHAGESSFTAP